MEQLRYNSKPTMVVGKRIWTDTETNEVYVETNRAVLIFDISNILQTTLKNEPNYVDGENFSVDYCSLTLTESTNRKNGKLFAFMAPTSCSVDESVSWDNPTEKEKKQGIWFDGGTIEPLAKNIIVSGEWNGDNIVFNITPFVNIWKSKGTSTFAVIITSDETETGAWEFYSQQSEPMLLGGKLQTNLRFLGAGDTNTVSTEGIVVKISPNSSNFTIEPVDPSKTGMNRWNSFNASISIGDTFAMKMPDTTTNTTIFTLLDKRSTQSDDTELLVSGSTTEFSTTKHGTAEFSCVGRIESGYGIVEFANPDNSLKTDLDFLTSGEAVIFNYKPTVTPNNAKSFTVDFYMDETLKNNRSRLYVKEQTVSENRNGSSTRIQWVHLRPRLAISLSF